MVKAMIGSSADLFQQLQAALADRDAKEQAKDEAAQALELAANAYHASSETFAKLQADANRLFGLTKNDRVRQG